MRAIPGVTLTAATLLALVAAVLLALVAPTAAASDSADPRLSATLVGRLEAGETARLAVRWDGPEGALLDLWVDLDGDGIAVSHELVAEGRPLTPGIEVVSFELPPGVTAVPEPTVWVRARDGGWCDEESTVATAEDGDVCGWQPGFGADGTLDVFPEAMAVFDDGSGPALYLAGPFTTAGGQSASHIARWDGTAWSALGTGLEDPSYVRAMALTVFDDGSGPALYVGGEFDTAGGVEANGIARWDGSAWSALSGPAGTGVAGQNWQVVLALAVFDDGSGPALYAGGGFDTAGGVEVNSIARWDGNSWSALSGPSAVGVDYGVAGLAVYDDGSGPALYAGGSFDNAGGVETANIARWDGSSWSALSGPSGVGVSDIVIDLAVFDDGSGPALYVGGEFDTAGGVMVSRIARWDGAAWSALSGPSGTGVDDTVYELEVFDDGSGPALFVGGAFSTAGGVTVNHIARWDGTVWSELDGASGVFWNSEVCALGVYDDGFGPQLYAGGWFWVPGGVFADNIARWDGGGWSPLVDLSGTGVDDSVEALAVFDDGSGPALYAGGEFTHAGGVEVNNIARWDGFEWSALSGANGVGLDGPTRALAIFDDGSGPALYVGGGFATAGGVKVHNIAKWSGSQWSALAEPAGADVDGDVRALAVYHDGSGPALYAGGRFLTAGGVNANGIVRWDGVEWSALGGGVLGYNGYPGFVDALAVFDNGSGSALYAGGWFEIAGEAIVNCIASWDGVSWSDLAGGMWTGSTDAVVIALEVFDDGSGSALYAGGFFDGAGGLEAPHIARWDGTTWFALSEPSGMGLSYEVYELGVFDDGLGPALYAGGAFNNAGGGTVNKIARWDGVEWSPLYGPSGTGMEGGSYPRVYALAGFDPGSGPTLFAGGSFSTAGGLRSNNIAAWRCDFGVIFLDSFEDGTTSAWSHTMP